MSSDTHYLPYTHQQMDIGSKLPVRYTGRNVVGIDLSMTSTGVATLTGDGFLDTYSIPSSPKTGTQLERQTLITNTVMGIIHKFEAIEDPVCLVIMEGYAMGATGQVFTLGELGGIMKFRLHAESYNLGIMPPSTLKQFVGAKGNAKKPDTMAAAKANFGLEFDTTDQTDAACLAVAANYTACLIRSPNVYPMLKYQLSALSKIAFATVAKID